MNFDILIEYFNVVSIFRQTKIRNNDKLENIFHVAVFYIRCFLLYYYDQYDWNFVVVIIIYDDKITKKYLFVYISISIQSKISLKESCWSFEISIYNLLIDIYIISRIHIFIIISLIKIWKQWNILYKIFIQLFNSFFNNNFLFVFL